MRGLSARLRVGRRGAVCAALAFICAIAAAPASGQVYLASPKALFQSSLDGADVKICGLYKSGGDFLNTFYYTVRGWPTQGAGNLSLSGSRDTPDAGGDNNCGILTFSYSGTFYTDQQLSIVTDDVLSRGGAAVLGPIPVFVNDPGLAVGEGAYTATEHGGRAHIPVRLHTLPQGDVTVGVTSLDTSEGSVSPLRLTFTTTNWSQDQTVTVTGLDDGLNDGDQIWNVRLNTGSTDDGDYNSLANVDVPVVTLDQTDGPTQSGIAITSTPANSGATGWARPSKCGSTSTKP